jgi:hypothetical protein
VLKACSPESLKKNDAFSTNARKENKSENEFDSTKSWAGGPPFPASFLTHHTVGGGWPTFFMESDHGACEFSSHHQRDESPPIRAGIASILWAPPLGTATTLKSRPGHSLSEGIGATKCLPFSAPILTCVPGTFRTMFSLIAIFSYLGGWPTFSTVSLTNYTVGAPSFRAVCERVGFHTVRRTNAHLTISFAILKDQRGRSLTARLTKGSPSGFGIAGRGG